MAKRKKTSETGRWDGPQGDNDDTAQKRSRHSQSLTKETLSQSPPTIPKNSTKIKFDEEGNIQSSLIASSPPILFKPRTEEDPSASGWPQFSATNSVNNQHMQPPLRSNTTGAKMFNQVDNGQNFGPTAKITGMQSFALSPKAPEYAGTPGRKQPTGRSESNEPLWKNPYMISVPVDPWSQKSSIRQRSDQNRQRVHKNLARERDFSSHSGRTDWTDPRTTDSGGKLQHQSHNHIDRYREKSASSNDDSTSESSGKSSTSSSFSENGRYADHIHNNELDLPLMHDQQKSRATTKEEKKKMKKRRRSNAKVAKDSSTRSFNDQAKSMMKTGRELLEIEAAKTITDTGERLDRKGSRNSDEEVAQKREKAKQAIQSQLIHELAQIIPNFALTNARQALEKENRQKSKHKKHIVNSSQHNHDLAVLHAAKSLILRLSAQALTGQGVGSGGGAAVAAAESQLDKDSNNLLSQRFATRGGLTNELARIARGREQRIEMLELEVRSLKERH